MEYEQYFRSQEEAAMRPQIEGCRGLKKGGAMYNESQYQRLKRKMGGK